MWRLSDYAKAAAAATGALPRAVAEMSRHGRPSTLLYFGAAPGDDLLCTPILAALAAGGESVWMMSNHPDIFRNNPSVAHVLPYDDAVAWALSLTGVRRARVRYHDYDPVEDRSLAPDEHIIHLMARRAGLDPACVELHPRVYLDAVERGRGRFGPRQIAIQSSGGRAARPISTKEWYPERFQAVVDALVPEVTFVQLGTAADPALDHVVDLRGKTTIREAAAVLAQSDAFVGLVGFLMHLARAVGTRSVIVYGGREHPRQSGYEENINIGSSLECSPCWLWTRCPFERACMQQITPAHIVDAVRRLLSDR